MVLNPNVKEGRKLCYHLAKEQGITVGMVLAPKHETSGMVNEGPILAS